MADFNEILDLATLIYSSSDVPKTVLIIEGESGIGKTQLTFELMKRLPDYEEPVVLSVPHLNLEDIGRTTMSGDGFLTFIFNETFAPAAPGKKKMIVFDEWNRYDNDSVGNFLMAITNERRIAGVKIHDSIRFMATQNPSSPDYSGTRPCTDLAETRRLNPVHMIFSPDRFLQYAKDTFTSELSVFLTQHPESTLIPGKLNCPRQWERFDKDVLRRVNVRWKGVHSGWLPLATWRQLPFACSWTLSIKGQRRW